METKTCSSCKERKSLDQFYRRPNPTARCKKCLIAGAVAWQKRYPERISAHQKVSYAVKIGKLVKPDSCEMCGNTGSVDAHHEDYDKPLMVAWLCDKCHRTRHETLDQLSFPEAPIEDEPVSSQPTPPALISQFMAEMGRKGGSARSQAKTESCRANAKKRWADREKMLDITKPVC